jgi:hypothetical protein
MTSTAIIMRDEQQEIPRATVRDQSRALLEGEKRLMLAVLERAVDDFRTYANVSTGRGRWLFMEVAAWFHSSDTGPFDFEGICQATALDPEFIRNGLRSRYGTQHPRLHDVPDGNCVMSSSMPTVCAVETSVDPARIRH